MHKTKILLIRHGETAWNVQGKMQGHVNEPLNENGIKQAKLLASHIHKTHPDIAAIYSSDLDRAFMTAFETATLLNLNIEKRWNLREIHWGEAEGQKASFFKDKTIISGAESQENLLKRMKSEIIEIASKYPQKKLALFSHSRAIRVIMADALKSEAHFIPNCAIVHFTFDASLDSDPLKFHGIENIVG